VVQRKLWKLKRPDPRKCYTATRDSPTLVLVLEQGSRVLHREKIVANDSARYVIADGWLVEETYPAGQQRAQRAAEKQRAENAREAAAIRALSFQALLAELTEALGPPDTIRERPTVYAFPAPSSAAQCAAWFERARAAGGAATVDAGELCVVVGRMSQLSALFGWYHWQTAKAIAALNALDKAAGLQITAIGHGSFEVALDRVPAQISELAARLAACFDARPRAVEAALRKRRWRASR
jgi:hypothetical protein